MTERERNTFHDQKQAKEFMTTQMASEKTLERILQTEEKGTWTHEAIEKDKPCWGSSEANEEQENIKKKPQKTKTKINVHMSIVFLILVSTPQSRAQTGQKKQDSSVCGL